jgi:predicted CXXCH cytochrome family protein
MKNNLSSNVSNTVSNTVKNDLSNSKYLGFDRDLSKSVDAWFMDTTVNSKTLSPKNIDHSQQVLVCAQCHSRRTQVSEKDHVKGNTFGETYLLDLISNTNYHPDGQVYNENFVYGSFLQSKMYQKGVVCSDCHDPHSAKLKLPVETLCLQCHQSESYATPKHHQHEAESSGAQCVNCHMPETTYMEIDARRDHGFHIPRPDLAKQLGTPDTCLSCHEDKNSDWSLQNVNQWFPQSTVADEKDFPPVFAATNMLLNEKQLQGLANELSRIAQTIGYAPIIRASALSKMSNMSNTNTIIAIARAVKNSDENIRLGAIEGTQNMASAEKWRILSPLLNDKVFAVRTNAAFALTNLWQEVTPAQQQQLTPALNEYLASQAYNSDRSFAHSNTGIVYIYQQQYTKAIEAFKKGIKIEPYFAQTYLNLSQVYRQLGQDDLALKTFKAGIAANPKNAELPYNLALAYIRMKDTVQAAEYLSQATQRAPDNSHYFYVYGLALEQVQPKKSYKALYQAFQISQDPQHLYALCDMQIRHENIHAKRCLTKLTPLVPANISQALNQRLKGISHE